MASSLALPDELAQLSKQAASSPQELLHLSAIGAQWKMSALQVLSSEAHYALRQSWIALLASVNIVSLLLAHLA